MSTLGIDGLASGLDTTGIINSLMSLERAPVLRMQQRIKENDAAMASLRAFDTAMAGIRSLAEGLAGDTSTFVPVTATSSSPTVAATAAAGAQTGTTTFAVDALAKTHRLVSAGTTAALTDLVATPGSTVDITVGGTTTSVATGDGSLGALISGINDAGIAVEAQAVDTGGGGLKLQLSAASSGAAAAFTVDTTNLDSGFASGTATAGTPLAVLSQGADARITLGDGPGAFSVSSATNTFADVVAGLSFTVTQADPATPVTITVAQDTAALTTQVESFVKAVDTILKDFDEATASGKDGKKGSLANDPTVRSLRSRLLGAVTFGVGGALGSAGQIGIESTRTGGLTFDKARFEQALAADPAAVIRVFRSDDPSSPGIAQRVQALAEAATARGTGTFATAIESRTSRNTTLQDAIDRMDIRLELRRASLQRQFAALEVALSGMNAQSQWLAGQLPALQANSPSNR